MTAQLSFDELGTPLRETSFVVVDLETTGGRAADDGITEIAAVKVKGGEVLGEFSTLVNPGQAIPPQIVSLTGITHAMVADAPTIDAVLPGFLEFAAGSVLVAHNAGFDTGFLKAACRTHGYAWPRPSVLCTVRLARRVLPRQDVSSCTLSALAALFGASTPSHRALDDARATVDVLHALIERVGPLGVHSLEELLEYLPEITAEQRRKRTLAAHLPQQPGVYLFRGRHDEVLYVGTAGNLQRRVRQYFTGSEGRGRMREMVALAERVEAVECAHALEAEVRELRLLAAHRPPYNRLSKNKHDSWWIRLTDEAFPRLSIVRTPRDGALGPFRSRAAAERAAETLTAASGLRACTDRIPATEQTGTPCALADLGRCGAPCAGEQTTQEYAPSVRAVADLFAGTDQEPLRSAAQSITDLAAAQHFERAAGRRDELATLVQGVFSAHRMAALAAIAELIAAAPDGSGGWHIAVIRYGRLASAGTVRRAQPPMPVIDGLVASAETVIAGQGPLNGAGSHEVTVLLRWLRRTGVRLVRTTEPWAEPARAAGPWYHWLNRAAQANNPERAC